MFFWGFLRFWILDWQPITPQTRRPNDDGDCDCDCDDNDNTFTVTVNDYDYSYGYGYGCDYYATTVRHYGYGLFVVERITQLVRTELERQAGEPCYVYVVGMQARDWLGATVARCFYKQADKVTELLGSLVARKSGNAAHAISLSLTFSQFLPLSLAFGNSWFPHTHKRTHRHRCQEPRRLRLQLFSPKDFCHALRTPETVNSKRKQYRYICTATKNGEMDKGPGAGRDFDNGFPLLLRANIKSLSPHWPRSS